MRKWYKFTEEQKQRLRESHLWQIPRNRWLKWVTTPRNKWIPMSEEAKQKMIASKKWRKNSLESNKKNSESHKWERAYQRQWWKWLYKKKQALKRDNRTCKECWFREDDIMVVDHIKPKSAFPELKFHLDNLSTLCPNCHARKTIREKRLWYDRDTWILHNS